MGGTAVFQFCELPQQPSNVLTRPTACLALAKLSGGLTLGTKRVLTNCVRVRVTGDSESPTSSLKVQRGSKGHPGQLLTQNNNNKKPLWF